MYIFVNLPYTLVYTVLPGTFAALHIHSEIDELQNICMSNHTDVAIFIIIYKYYNEKFSSVKSTGTNEKRNE